MDAVAPVLDEVHAERLNQHLKWGEQNWPNGTGTWMNPIPLTSANTGELRDVLKKATDRKALNGRVTYRDILMEEVFEAIAEEDPEKLRTELIQLAAVAVQWVQAIDRGKQQA
jgi:hypothetical protein